MTRGLTKSLSTPGIPLSPAASIRRSKHVERVVPAKEPGQMRRENDGFFTKARDQGTPSRHPSHDNYGDDWGSTLFRHLPETTCPEQDEQPQS